MPVGAARDGHAVGGLARVVAAELDDGHERQRVVERHERLGVGDVEVADPRAPQLDAVGVVRGP